MASIETTHDCSRSGARIQLSPVIPKIRIGSLSLLKGTSDLTMSHLSARHWSERERELAQLSDLALGVKPTTFHSLTNDRRLTLKTTRQLSLTTLFRFLSNEKIRFLFIISRHIRPLDDKPLLPLTPFKTQTHNTSIDRPISFISNRH